MRFAAWAPAPAAGTIDAATRGCAGAGGPCQELRVGTAEELVAAVAAAAAAGKGVATRILLAPGRTYHLNKTLTLGPDHSNTVISPASGAPAGDTVVSGSQELHVAWAKHQTARGIDVFVADVPKGLQGDALRVGGRRATLARHVTCSPASPASGALVSLGPVHARTHHTPHTTHHTPHTTTRLTRAHCPAPRTHTHAGTPTRIRRRISFQLDG